MAKLIEKARRIRLADLPPFAPLEMYEAVASWARNAGVSISDAMRYAEWGILPVAGGAVGSGEVMLQNVPSAPYEINPARFFVGTNRNLFKIAERAFAADTAWNPIEIPAVGILSKIVLQFEGTVTVGTAAATTTERWIYGLLDRVKFSANGQDDLFSCRGIQLKQLEVPRYPYNDSTADDEAGPSFASGQNLAVGVHELRATYEIPLAFDEASLIGSVFAQSRALSLMLNAKDAAVAQIATAGGGGTVAVAGTWTIAIETYQIPVDPSGKIVLPDLRFMHGFNEIVKPFANLGNVEVPLIRVAGTLQRLFAQSIRKDTAAPAYYNPANEDHVDAYKLRFGGNKVPYDFTPAQMLVARNVRDYGRTLGYGGVVLDLARYNPVRDVINLAGITEAYWVTTLDSGATAPDASAQQVIVEETLFQ